MALPSTTGFADQYDFINTIFQQGNTCPICHLPLVFSNQGMRHHGIAQRGADNLWMTCVSLMKEGILNNANFYGYIKNNNCNAEKCHYVSKTMITEVSKPFLLESPVVGQILRPELILYLRADLARNANYRLFQYNFDDLLHRTNQRRLNKANSLFNLMSSRFFYGCKDCNMVHTGHHQLRHIANETYQLNLAPAENGQANCINLYTLLFDSMAECDGNENRITIDSKVCITWNIRLWINYCTLMFLAQNEASNTRTKLVSTYKTHPHIYYFHYAHRDMGLCDFYMCQIIGAFLYANYDIEMDFMFLYQNFLVRLPFWAEINQLFVTPINGYRSLWRMVIGIDTGNQSMLPICNDLASNANAYNLGHNFYWLTSNQNIDAKISFFVNTWVNVIGVLLELHYKCQNENEVLAQIPQVFSEQHDLVTNLYEFFYHKCDTKYTRYKTMVGFVRDEGSFFSIFARTPTLNTTKQLFRACNLDTEIFYNFIKLSLPRHRSVIHSFGLGYHGNAGQAAQFRIKDKFDKLQNLAIEIFNI